MSEFSSEVLKFTGRFHERHEGLPKRARGPDNTGGGDGMDGRLEKLEGRIDKIDDRLRSVEVNLATLTERVAHLPSKGFIVSTFLTAGSILSAVILFADQIKAAFG